MDGGRRVVEIGPSAECLVDDADSIVATHEALDCGINWIDTAPVYGLGHSEEVVAKALAGLPAERRPYVFTKCGRV